MARTTRLAKAARRTLEQCLDLQPAEKLLVLANPEMEKLAWAVYEEGRKLTSQVAAMFFPAAGRDGEEPPRHVADAMARADVVVAFTLHSITHTQARRRACQTGTRIATLPGITEEAFLRGLSVDTDELAEVANRLFRYLDGAKVVHVTSPSGCDLVLDVRNRAVVSDGNIRAKGAYSNLPAGEAEVAPRTAEGVLVADRCGGILSRPTRFEIKAGRIVGYDSTPSGRRVKRLIAETMEREGNENASLVAEFAIGANRKAKVSGIAIEEEKALGTCHVAFGDNTSYPGGRNRSALHLDFLVLKPTIALDGKVIMEKGKLLI
jgi:leucyl aminopeptidase (aminopeptidase T)